MKQTLLIITALMLIVGCSADPIDGSTLIEKGGLMYAPYSGEAVWYYDNGQKWEEGHFKDGKEYGKWTRWYKNGQKKKEATLKDGKPDGLYTKWYENGQKELAVTIKDGKEDGKVTKWYKNGQKEEKSTYKDGELISEKCWDEDGNEEDCIRWEMSDIRLKDNVTLLEQETSSSPNIYSFNYKWDKDTKWRGVIAQELINTNYSDAVSISPEGYYMVDYARLGFPMTQILN